MKSDLPNSQAPIQTLIIDLLDCCITQNYWHEILKPYWAQNVPSFLAERWTAPSFQSSFERLAEALDALDNTAPLHAPDALSYSEKIIRCIQKDQWPSGLSALLSQLVTLGVGTDYLQAQIHADAINSLRRWHNRGWRIITVCELSSLAQRHLLQNTQAGDLSRYTNYHIPLCTRLPKIPACGLISARESVLIQGRALGYQTLCLNRLYGVPSTHSEDSDASSVTSQNSESVTVLDMDLSDLLLTK